MKIHSLDSLKALARKGTIEAVPLGGSTIGRARGTVVQVEHAPIIVLFNPTSDSFLWIVGGEFVAEQDVQRYVADPAQFDHKADVSVEETFARFDAWRAQQIPLVNMQMKTKGRATFETIIRLNDAWLTVYTGPEGYTRIQERISSGSGPVPIDVLSAKKKLAEQSLFDTSEKFLAEYTRLEMTPVAA